MLLDAIYKIKNIIFRDYGDISIVYNPLYQKYVVLSSVGSDIWRYLYEQHDEGATLKDIVDYICNLYGDVTRNVVEEDVRQLIEEWAEKDYIVSLTSPSTNNIPQTSITATQEDSIENKLIELLGEQDRIYSATLEITYSCNEKCIHCYATYPNSDSTYRNLNIDDWKRVIDELYELKCLHLIFTGGDPFMLPNFIELLEYAGHKGFIIDVYTNGLAITEHEEYIPRIRVLLPRAFYISMYGNTPETHDNITQIKGSYGKTLTAVKLLKEAGVQVVLNIVAMKMNYHALLPLIELAKQIGVQYRIGLTMITRNNGDKTPLSYFIDDNKTLEGLLRIEKKVYNMDVLVLKEQPKSGLICAVGTASLCVSPYGNVYPCLSLKKDLGSVFENSIADIWDSDKRRNYVYGLTWENMSECKTCKYIEYCAHCVANSDSEISDVFSCNTCDRLLAECLYSLSQDEEVVKNE